MTYFGFLLMFLVVPIGLLAVLAFRERGQALPPDLQAVPIRWVVAALVGIALIYTTPWDNYLVATRVWWYNPVLVTGITFGYIPLEEYTFFVLQTLFIVLWFTLLARRIHIASHFAARRNFRLISVSVMGILWLTSVMLLVAGWKPGHYLVLIFVWALPAIGIQLAVGADILWHYRRLVAAVLIPLTLYLCCADTIAIHSGTWTINPELTTGILLGGILPIEEAIFFLLTSTLLVFGLVLGLTKESLYRLPANIMRRKASQTIS